MPLTPTEFLVILAVLTTALFHGSVSDESSGEECHVYITVGSFWYKSSKNDGLKGLQTRQLEMNWDSEVCGEELYSVFLFSSNPKSASFSATDSFLDSAVCSHHPRNFHRTNVTLGRPQLPGGWDKETVLQNEVNNVTTLPTPGDHCLPYWIAAYDRNGTLLTSDCLKIRPTWMGDMKSQIGGARVSQIMIPGTHNSGCFYGKDIQARGDVLYRFTRTQDEDVWEQLVWGARYILDKPRAREDHRTAANLAGRGSIFANEVIVDFHRFPVGFSGKFQQYAVRHRWLANLINEELGHIAAQCVFMSSPRLGDLWHSGKRVLVYHAKRHEVHVNWNDDWLCAPMLQAWGDQQNATGLTNYIEEAMQKYTGRPLPWSVMAELTPKYTDAILRPQRGLRMMADDVNRGITNLFRHLWWRDANVVATDFLLGNKIIDVAIESNEKRFPKYAPKTHFLNDY